MAKGLYNFMFKAPSEEKQNNNLNNQLSYDNGGPGDPPHSIDSKGRHHNYRGPDGSIVKEYEGWTTEQIEASALFHNPQSEMQKRKEAMERNRAYENRGGIWSGMKEGARNAWDSKYNLYNPKTWVNAFSSNNEDQDIASGNQSFPDDPKLDQIESNYNTQASYGTEDPTQGQQGQWDPNDWRTWNNVDRRVSSAVSSSRGKGTSTATPDVRDGDGGEVDERDEISELEDHFDIGNTSYLDVFGDEEGGDEEGGDEEGGDDLFGSEDLFSPWHGLWDENEKKGFKKEDFADTDPSSQWIKDARKKNRGLTLAETMINAGFFGHNLAKKMEPYQSPQQVVGDQVTSDKDKYRRMATDEALQSAAIAARNAQEMGGTPYSGTAVSSNIPKMKNKIEFDIAMQEAQESSQNANMNARISSINASNKLSTQTNYQNQKRLFEGQKQKALGENVEAGFSAQQHGNLVDTTAAKMLADKEAKKDYDNWLSLDPEKVLTDYNYISYGTYNQLKNEVKEMLLTKYGRNVIS